MSVGDVLFDEMGEMAQNEQAPRDFETALHDMSAIELRREEAEVVLMETVGEDAINSLFDAAHATLGEDEEITTANVYTAVAHILPSYFTNDQISDISPKIDGYFSAMQECEVISTEVEALGRIETERVLDELTRQVDWDALFARSFDEKGTDAEYGDFLRRIRSGGESHLGSIESARELKKWQARVTQEGLIRDTEDSGNEAIDRQAEWLSGDLERGVQDWLTATRRSMVFLIPSKREDDGRLSFMHKTLDDFQKLNIDDVVVALGETSCLSAKSKTPPLIIEACKRQIARLMEEFDNAEHEFLAQDLDETIPLVQGNRLFEEATGVDRASDWVQEKMQGFPHWYRRGLGFISFADPTTDPGLSLDNSGSDWDDGYYEGNENKININTDVVNKELRDLLPDTAKKISLQRIDATYSHELAHHAHARTIPVSWLRSWLTMCEREKIIVDSYIEHRGGQDEALSEDRELLAVCLEKYDTDPGSLLAVGAFEHMRYVNRLLRKYDQNHVEQIISKVQNHPKLPTIDNGVKRDIAREVTLEFRKALVV